VQTLKIGDPALNQAIQNAPEGGLPIKWAVNTDGELGIIPDLRTDGIEIHHSVIFNGEDVLSAGEGILNRDEVGNYIVDALDNNSGHYVPANLALWDAAYTNIGLVAFQIAGILGDYEYFVY
jgi:hypothetical protein